MKIHETPKREKLRVLVIWGVKRHLKRAADVQQAMSTDTSGPHPEKVYFRIFQSVNMYP